MVVFFNYYWFILSFFIFIFLGAHYIDKWVGETPTPKCNNCKYWEPIDLHEKIGNCKKRNNIITKEDEISKYHKYKKNERENKKIT